MPLQHHAHTIPGGGNSHDREFILKNELAFGVTIPVYAKANTYPLVLFNAERFYSSVRASAASLASNRFSAQAPRYTAEKTGSGRATDGAQTKKRLCRAGRIPGCAS